MNWVYKFVNKFNMWIKPLDPLAKQKFLDHVNIFMAEEWKELNEAVERGDVEEVVDALGDLSWHCDKAMIMVGVNPAKVRDEIGRANLSKELGVKKGREKALLDVVKPKGWVGPDHRLNHGDLDDVLKN